MRKRIIFVLLLAFLVGAQSGVMHAQVKGSPTNNVNALDYRYQQYNATKSVFADTLKFRDKVYNLVGFGLVSDFENGISEIPACINKDVV